MSAKMFWLIRRAFPNVDRVNLSGGEPMLVQHLFFPFTREIEYINIEMTSNGKWSRFKPERIVDNLTRLQRYSEHQDTFYVRISNDTEHKGQRSSQDNWIIDEVKECLPKEVEIYYDDHLFKYGNYIQEGNSGSEIGDAYVKDCHCQQMDVTDTYDGSDYKLENMLYINIHGNVYSCGNLSYDSQRKKKFYICNIKQPDYYDKLERFYDAMIKRSSRTGSLAESPGEEDTEN